MSIPERVAIVGAGEIGSGWAALFAAFGAEVRIFDHDVAAERRARAALTDAVRCGVGVAHLGSVEAYVDLDDAVRGATWVQESLPERLELKHAMLGAIERALAPDAIVASSTSTYTAAELACHARAAGRVIVAHPLHPVYAVPVVELCGSATTTRDTLARAERVMRALGREPVVVGMAVPGLVANRLTAALLREALDLVARGVVTAPDLDHVVARGLALGWAAAGALGTEAIGAGPGGLAAYLERFSGPLARVWASLATWHTLTAFPPEQRAALAAAAHAIDSADGYKKAHALGESAWAETLARIAHAATGDGQAT